MMVYMENKESSIKNIYLIGLKFISVICFVIRKRGRGQGKRDVRYTHYAHTYQEYHSVCPLVGIGTLPPPLSSASVPLPPEPKGGGGHTCVRVRGWGSPNSNDWRKSLALCLLCGYALNYRCAFVPTPERNH